MEIVARIRKSCRQEHTGAAKNGDERALQKIRNRGMRKKKKRLDEFLSFFENKKSGEENENIAVLQRITRFLKNFRSQSLQYKIVWTARITLWAILICAAVLGIALRIRNNIR